MIKFLHCKSIEEMVFSRNIVPYFVRLCCNKLWQVGERTYRWLNKHKFPPPPNYNLRMCGSYDVNPLELMNLEVIT